MLDALTGGNGVTERRQPDDAVGKGQDELGSEDFLKLMMTQFQNQDPFKPMESGEMLGQMAHFTSANGITQMQKSFDQFAGRMMTDQGLQAVSLVGRDVLVDGGRGQLRDGEPLRGAVKVPSGVDNLTVRIENTAGELVRELQLGAQGAGQLPFQWDGLNQSGARMPAGEYRINAQVSRDGETSSLDTLTGARVSSVSLGQGGSSPMLMLEGVGEKPLSDVRQIQ